MNTNEGGFIPPHGGYRRLKSYIKAEIVYDATVYFCGRFHAHNRRQTDQMEQAARSGKQNIAEGSLASATSKRTEVHLTNVARASLGELLEDYHDFLRTRGLPCWTPEHPEAARLSGLARLPDESYATYRSRIEDAAPEVSANTIRHLILQACFLLDRQIGRLERDFVREGGIRERMTAARLKARAPGPPRPARRDGVLGLLALPGVQGDEGEDGEDLEDEEDGEDLEDGFQVLFVLWVLFVLCLNFAGEQPATALNTRLKW